jgi:hypothetical protein
MLARVHQMVVDEVEVRCEAQFLRRIWRIGHRSTRSMLDSCSRPLPGTLAADRFPAGRVSIGTEPTDDRLDGLLDELVVALVAAVTGQSRTGVAKSFDRGRHCRTFAP